jgi:hypothetical protein
MELHMHSHHFARRMPDWRAAVIGGCVAGAVFLVLELLAMWAIGQSPWGPPRMIAAIVLGRDALIQPATFDASIMLAALIVHFVLAIIFAVILAVIMAPFSLDSSVGMVARRRTVRRGRIPGQSLRHDRLFPVVRGGPRVGELHLPYRVRAGGGRYVSAPREEGGRGGWNGRGNGLMPSRQ